MARRTVLTSRQRAALFALPQREADLLRHYLPGPRISSGRWRSTTRATSLSATWRWARLRCTLQARVQGREH